MAKSCIVLQEIKIDSNCMNPEYESIAAYVATSCSNQLNQHVITPNV